jgi:excisionase family DNA binding protein/PAS domain S-box-containing protein
VCQFVSPRLCLSPATDRVEDCLVNLKQAARYLGVHYQTAYKLVRSGKLSAVRVGAGYEISEAALERYLAERKAIHRAGDTASGTPAAAPACVHAETEDPWAPAIAALDAPIVNAPTVEEFVADALVAVLGDLVSIREIAADGTHFEPAIVRHADPVRRSLAASWLGTWRRPITGDETFEQVAAGHAVLIPHLRQDKLREAVDPELIQYLDLSGVHSLIAVPAFLGDEVVALVAVTRDEPGRPYTKADVATLERAASIVAAAIGRERLADGSRARRRALVEAVTGILAHDAASPDVATALADFGYGEIICDPSGRVVAVNEAVTRFSGWLHRDVVGHPLSDLALCPGERDEESEVFKRLVHGELTYVDARRTAMRHDGSQFQVDVRHAIVHNRFAEPRAVVVVASVVPEPPG